MKNNSVHIPTGPKIVTRHGCICKHKWKTEDGKTVTNSCSLHDSSEPWCEVKGKCGIYVGEETKNSQWYDICTPHKRSFFEENVTYGRNYFKTNILGIIIYILIFVITIPLLLYKFGLYEILEVYMPNFDLLATAISFNGGPLNYPIFQELYNKNTQNWLGYISSLFINYISLLGLTFLVARRVKYTKSVIKGWSIGFVMLLLTYLVPNEFIALAQEKLSKFYNIHTDYQVGGKNLWDDYLYYIIVVIFGLSIASLFILLEKTLLANHKYWLDYIIKDIIDLKQYF